MSEPAPGTKVFGVVKDVHVDTCFGKSNGRTNFRHVRYGACELDKLIIGFYVDVEFNFGLGDHTVQIFQMPADEF